VLIDFSSHILDRGLASLTARAGVAHVIGTPACRRRTSKRLAEAARKTVIVRSGNMSLGVNLLACWSSARRGPSGRLGTPRSLKSPPAEGGCSSGTAFASGRGGGSRRGVNLSEHSARRPDGLTGRASWGYRFREPARRHGHCDHSVIFAGVGERIEFSACGRGRGIFARGALAAALWTRVRPRPLFDGRRARSFRWLIDTGACKHESHARPRSPGESEWNARNLFTGWKNRT